MATDIREEKLNEISRHLTVWARSKAFEIRRAGSEPEDFVQDVLVNIWRRKGLDQYDETKTRSFQALIYNIAKRYLIDLNRKAFQAKSRQTLEGTPYVTVSIQQNLSTGGEEFTLADVIEGERARRMILLELLDSIPDTQISPNYRLTWRDLCSLSDQMEAADIAAQIGISESRIRQLQKELYRRFVRAA